MKKNLSLLREDWQTLRALWQPGAGATQLEVFGELAGIINGLTGADLLDALLFRSHTVEMPQALVNALDQGRKRFAAEVRSRAITTRQQTSEKALLLLAVGMLARKAGGPPEPVHAEPADEIAPDAADRALEPFEL